MGTYDSQGVPDYLEPVNDVIDAGLLQNINNALPEYQPVPDYHPEYLAAGNQTSLSLLSEADVWVTFVHEGAGYKNVLGYFTYTTGSPPSTLSDVDSITIVFPNVSFQNSGGGLHSGNKVWLGTFPANTSIGWVVIANAWQGGIVGSGYPEYYSEPALNPETNPDLRQHNVLLYDAEYDLVLIGFEDLNREGSCDNDFNDAIFYTTANPPEAVDITNLPYVDPTLNDGDGDGVVDAADDYPADPNKAFNHYYPGLDQYSTLSFEDQWPSKGDYDFNDLVIDFNINQITNASNDIVEIDASFNVKAVGAGFKNGYGFDLPLNPGDVLSVTGMDLQEGFISLNANNTEAGQAKATIVVFDNTFNLWPSNHVRHINTVPGEPSETPANIGVNITLANPAPISSFDIPPYNPFVIIDGERGREVHLPGYPPTSLVNSGYFGTEDDDSDPSIGKYYKTDSDLPWGMHLPVSFDYPIEKKPVILGHLKFSTWVQSGGFSFMDWYENKPGYRNSPFIYPAD
jgi:LruC domain-containing protein